jgi:hypothetical protein
VQEKAEITSSILSILKEENVVEASADATCIIEKQSSGAISNFDFGVERRCIKIARSSTRTVLTAISTGIKRGRMGEAETSAKVIGVTTCPDGTVVENEECAGTDSDGSSSSSTSSASLGIAAWVAGGLLVGIIAIGLVVCLLGRARRANKEKSNARQYQESVPMRRKKARGSLTTKKISVSPKTAGTSE